MVWIRLWISCIAFLSVAGGISFGMIKLVQRIRCTKNPLLLLALQKISLVLYWLPIPFVWVCISRISYIDGVSSYSGEFVCSTVPQMTVIFGAIGIIWFSGVILSVISSGIKTYRLAALTRGNIPIQDARYLDLFEECRRQKRVDKVSLSQNDLLGSPITAGLVRKQILLPVTDYTDTELRMIYEHELTHIKNRDLPWRIFALVTSWIHWFNPVVYMQLGELDCVQEIICDLSISLDNVHYTKKEYAAFLVKLTGQETVSAYTPALIENKNQTLRRIDEMAKTTGLNRLGKRIMGFSCVCLAVSAMIPAIAVSARTAKLQEDWIRAEEIEVEMELLVDPYQDFSDPTQLEHGNAADDVGITEIDGSQEVEEPKMDKNSPFVDLDKRIPPNARQVYKYMHVSAGDTICIIVKNPGSGLPYKIGIKNKETGEAASAIVTGTGLYWVEIPKDGSYAIFIENNSKTTLEAYGVGRYFFKKKGNEMPTER